MYVCRAWTAADPEALAGFFIAQRGLRHFLMRVLGYSKCSQTCVINHSRFLWGSCKWSWDGAPRRRRSSRSLGLGVRSHRVQDAGDHSAVDAYQHPASRRCGADSSSPAGWQAPRGRNVMGGSAAHGRRRAAQRARAHATETPEWHCGSSATAGLRTPRSGGRGICCASSAVLA